MRGRSASRRADAPDHPPFGPRYPYALSAVDSDNVEFVLDVAMSTPFSKKTSNPVSTKTMQRAADRWAVDPDDVMVAADHRSTSRTSSLSGEEIVCYGYVEGLAAQDARPRAAAPRVRPDALTMVASLGTSSPPSRRTASVPRNNSAHDDTNTQSMALSKP